MSDLRYPLGPMPTPQHLSPGERRVALKALHDLPGQLRVAVAGLDDAALDTPYREGGWSVRQVVHHVADSHLNAYARLKLALTEANPVVKPYEEARWADLPDSALPPEVSLRLVEDLHTRLLAALDGVEDGSRPWTHPASGSWTLDTLLAMYAWHGAHHVAQITGLRRRQGW